MVIKNKNSNEPWVSGAKQAATHHPETMEKVRKEEQQSQWEDGKKQKSNNQTSLQLELKKHTKDSPDDRNSVPVGTKREKNQPLKLFSEKNNSDC